MVVTGGITLGELTSSHERAKGPYLAPGQISARQKDTHASSNPLYYDAPPSPIVRHADKQTDKQTYRTPSPTVKKRSPLDQPTHRPYVQQEDLQEEITTTHNHKGDLPAAPIDPIFTTAALQQMPAPPRSGRPLVEMVKNSMDVGMEVNMLRTIPIANIVQVMTASEIMTVDEVELVWPHISFAAAMLLDEHDMATFSARNYKRKIQTDKQKKDTAYLAARAPLVWHQGLLSVLQGFMSNVRNGCLQHEDTERVSLAIKTYEEELKTGRKVRKVEWVSLNECCRELLQMQGVDNTMRDNVDKMRENVVSLRKVLSLFVGIPCTSSWMPLDRQNKKEWELKNKKEWDLLTALSLPQGSKRGT